MTVHVPALYCPVQTLISPFVNQAEKEVIAWLIKFKLTDEADSERYQSERFVHMTARFYPGISYERLVILSQFFTLLFISDDQLDHRDNFREEDYWRLFAEEFMAVVTKNRFYDVDNDNPPLAALSDLWKRIIRLSTSEWQEQFIEGLKDMYKAAFWENQNISTGNPISLEQYMKYRQYLGAANVATDCISFAYPEIQLTPKEKSDPLITRITELCRNTVCWANDLFSLSKELEHGGIHNLVMLIQKTENVPINIAVKRAAKIHDEDVQQFYSLWKDVVETEDLYTSNIDTYFEALAALMKGNIVWSVRDTNRYCHFSYGESNIVKLPLVLSLSH